MLETTIESEENANNGRFWVAVRTRTTPEKRVSSLRSYKEYECVLPLSTARRCWSERVKQVELPLFPGYVFCRFDVHLRGPILKTPSVIDIAGLAGKPIPVDDHEIAAL